MIIDKRQSLRTINAIQHSNVAVSIVYNPKIGLYEAVTHDGNYLFGADFMDLFIRIITKNNALNIAIGNLWI
jgi:hypothetical protein